MNQAYIVIGSNIERRKNYLEALRRLAELGTIVTISSIYETKAIGSKAGDDYYNGAVLLETEYDAHSLKRALHRIEAEMGRLRTADPNAPRPIDLDIALFNQELIHDAELIIPDPLILERGFVALSLAEINPGYIHPINGRTLAEIAQRFGSTAHHYHRVADVTASGKEIISQKLSHEMCHVN